MDLLTCMITCCITLFWPFKISQFRRRDLNSCLSLFNKYGIKDKTASDCVSCPTLNCVNLSQSRSRFARWSWLVIVKWWIERICQHGYGPMLSRSSSVTIISLLRISETDWIAIAQTMMTCISAWLLLPYSIYRRTETGVWVCGTGFSPMCRK